MATGRGRARRGVTLIELLVVLAIVGLLAAMIVPAVQSARESARAATCKDHLRQVGLAILNHESAHGALPSLYNGEFLTRPRSPLDEFHFHSWRTAILPQVEQGATRAALDPKVPATAAANQTAINARVAIFVCPSTPDADRPVTDIFTWNDGAVPTQGVGTAARSDYEAIGGVRVAPQKAASHLLDGIAFGAWGEPTYRPSDAAWLRDREARLADIRDGLSSTILVGERSGRPDIYRKGEPVDRYPYRRPSHGTDHHQAAWGVSTHFPWLVLSGTPKVGHTNVSGLYSFHPGGAHAALADGSVRVLKESTASSILEALATRAGGEAAGPSD